MNANDLTPAEIEEQRGMFEAAWDDRWPNCQDMLQLYGGEYCTNQSQEAWIFWLASYAANRPSQPEPFKPFKEVV